MDAVIERSPGSWELSQCHHTPYRHGDRGEEYHSTSISQGGGEGLSFTRHLFGCLKVTSDSSEFESQLPHLLPETRCSPLLHSDFLKNQMANEHMKRCSVSLKEMHMFKNMLTYQFFTYQPAKIQQSDVF